MNAIDLTPSIRATADVLRDTEGDTAHESTYELSLMEGEEDPSGADGSHTLSHTGSQAAVLEHSDFQERLNIQEQPHEKQHKTNTVNLSLSLLFWLFCDTGGRSSL